MKTPQDSIRRAAEVVGGNAKLALAVKTSPSCITQWGLPAEHKSSRQVPAERCPLIEEATGGAVRCEDLRPDIRWDVLRRRMAAKKAA